MTITAKLPNMPESLKDLQDNKLVIALLPLIASITAIRIAQSAY